MVVSYEVPPMTYMLVLTAINVAFTASNIACRAYGLAVCTALTAVFCAVGALLMS
jgi:hypothetical protein